MRYNKSIRFTNTLTFEEIHQKSDNNNCKNVKIKRQNNKREGSFMNIEKMTTTLQEAIAEAQKLR